MDARIARLLDIVGHENILDGGEFGDFYEITIDNGVNIVTYRAYGDEEEVLYTTRTAW